MMFSIAVPFWSNVSTAGGGGGGVPGDAVAAAATITPAAGTSTTDTLGGPVEIILTADTEQGSTWYRPNFGTPPTTVQAFPDPDLYYYAQEFTAPITGTYTFAIETGTGVGGLRPAFSYAAFLYSDGAWTFFDPTSWFEPSPLLTGILIGVNNTGFTYSLTEGQTYVAVLSGLDDTNQLGHYRFTITA